jgi:hypothetical protein
MRAEKRSGRRERTAPSRNEDEVIIIPVKILLVAGIPARLVERGV